MTFIFLLLHYSIKLFVLFIIVDPSAIINHVHFKFLRVEGNPTELYDI